MRLVSLRDIGVQLLVNRRFFISLIVGIVVFTYLFTVFSPGVYQATISFYFPADRSLLGITAPTSQQIVKPPVPILGTDFIQSLYYIMKQPVFKTALKKNLADAGEPQKVSSDLRQDESGVYTIYIYDRKPERAAKVAEIYFKTINSVYENVSLETSRKNIDFLEDEIEKFESLHEDAEKKLNNFLEENGIAALAKETSILIEEKFRLESEIANRNIELKGKNARVNAIKSELADAESNISEFQIAEDPVITGLRQDLLAAEIKKQALSERFTDEHPEIIEINSKIKEIQTKIADELEKVIQVDTDGLNPIHEQLRSKLIDTLVDIQAANAANNAAEIRLKKLESLIEKNPDVVSTFDALKREEVKYKNILSSLDAKLEEAQLQILRDFDTFLQLSPATVPDKPKFPVLSINLTVGIILGIISSIMIAAFLANREKRHPLYLPEDILYLPGER